MKKAEDRGTPRGDTGKVTGVTLFEGHLFESRKPAFAAMMDYVTELPHAACKPVDLGMLLESPGAGKSFMLQRVYDTPLAPELELRSLRLILSFNNSMKTDEGALYQLVSRVLFTYFCGYPTVQIDSTLTKIGARVDLLFRGDRSSYVLEEVINLLEADFASYRQLDPASVRTIFFIDEAGQEKLGVLSFSTRMANKGQSLPTRLFVATSAELLMHVMGSVAPFSRRCKSTFRNLPHSPENAG
jgi:hypothetical protein